MTPAQVDGIGMGALALMVDSWGQLNGARGKPKITSKSAKRIEIFSRYKKKWQRKLA